MRSGISIFRILLQDTSGKFDTCKPQFQKKNEPRTAEVGVISKAQKYSRNNYCEIFQLSGYPLIEFKNFPKKVALYRKNPKGGPFGLPSSFGSIRNFCGLVRDSNPRSPASKKATENGIVSTKMRLQIWNLDHGYIVA